MISKYYMPILCSRAAAYSQTSFPVHHSTCHVNPCRVFILADPEVFSGSLGIALLGDIETYGSVNPFDHMCSVVQHSIQAALGAEQCHGPKLAQALKVSRTAR